MEPVWLVGVLANMIGVVIGGAIMYFGVRVGERLANRPYSVKNVAEQSAEEIVKHDFPDEEELLRTWSEEPQIDAEASESSFPSDDVLQQLRELSEREGGI